MDVRSFARAFSITRFERKEVSYKSMVSPTKHELERPAYICVPFYVSYQNHVASTSVPNIRVYRQRATGIAGYKIGVLNDLRRSRIVRGGCGRRDASSTLSGGVKPRLFPRVWDKKSARDNEGLYKRTKPAYWRLHLKFCGSPCDLTSGAADESGFVAVAISTAYLELIKGE